MNKNKIINIYYNNKRYFKNLENLIEKFICV